MKQIAQFLARWHQIEVPTENVEHFPSLWRTIDKWLELVPESFGNPEKDAKLKEINIPKIKEEAKILKEHISSFNYPVTFAHNDLLGPNIIYNEEQKRIFFIDYEYASHNYRGFDIANHFCEWAGYDLAYERYPNKEDQREFFCYYLEALGETPTEEKLHSMFVEVNKFALTSHFYWATWAVIQSKISNIDFDFLDYGRIRYNEYWKIKERMWELK